MQTKFGLKDFVILVAIGLLGLSIWLAMVQRDRGWDQVQAMQAKLSDLERQISRVETKLDQGVVAVAAPGPGGTAQRDESWARPGVKVDWHQPWNYATDPTGQSQFTIGGEFTEIFEAQPAKLVPFVQTDVYGRRVVDLVSEPLGVYDPKTLKLRGLLAEAWQYDPNGMWLRVRIHQRAKFSDGTPVTAEDVRWSHHDFAMNPQIEAERQRSIVADVIDRIEVIDERTVEFTFKDAFFSNLDAALTINVLPKHFYSRYSPAEINQSTGMLVGSGPYKMEDLNWAPPAAVVLVRNEQYWGPKPPLERIRFKAINDELARLTEYKNGDADMVTPSAPQYVSHLAQPGWKENNRCLAWINMRSGRGGLIWNCGPRNGKLTPFHDKRVRVAMTLLLDREKMIRDIWQGLGQVAKGFANPGTLGDDPARKAWPYDPPAGMKLLEEAGWIDRDRDGVLEDADGNPFVFEFTYPSGGEIGERIAAFVKDAYAAAGIRVNIRGMDWSVLDPIRDQRDFDALYSGWGANAPESDPKQIFHSESIQNQGDNCGQWNSPEADRFIDLARKELDTDKRAVLWREFERVMHEEQPYTWIRLQPYTRIIKPEIGNVNPYPKGLELWEFYRSPVALPTSGL